MIGARDADDHVKSVYAGIAYDSAKEQFRVNPATEYISSLISRAVPELSGRYRIAYIMLIRYI
jgi:hypothetical protein